MTGLNEDNNTTKSRSHEGRAVSFLGNPCEQGHARSLWSHPCGPTRPFYLNGNGASAESLMEGLAKLPQQIRYHIYELVTQEWATKHSPACWLDTRGLVMYPLLGRFSIEDGPFPTLERKEGYWGVYAASQFCHVQGLAEVLNRLQIDGLDLARDILEDFLTME